MSRKYKFQTKEGLYFVSFATVYWIDVFVRDQYFWEIAQSLDFCRRERGIEIFAWCIMPSHIHLIFRSNTGEPGKVLGNMKKHTSKQMQELILNNQTESRREWIAWMMQRAAAKNSNVEKMQFWQQHNKPIELWSPEIIEQKADYIHNNPVEAGFVLEPWHWKYSSAKDYTGGKGIIEIDML